MDSSVSAADFSRTMPPSYSQAFGSDDIAEHARIAAERGERSAHVTLWRRLAGGHAILCIVADDRPGLVLLLSAAFVAHGLDVQSAQIYSRRHPDGRAEAVDFFWVRSASADAELTTERVVACARTIVDFVGARAEPHVDDARVLLDDDVAPRVTVEPQADDPTRWLITLEVRDFPRLLLVVATILHHHALEITSSELSTQSGVARDRFVVLSATDDVLDADRPERVRAALIRAIRERVVHRG